MFDTNLRRKVGWLIAIRAIVSTLLLGSATFAQINAPGSFQINPFFFLIGFTYLLTIIYAATNGFLDPIPVEELTRYEQELYRFLETRHPGVLTAIASKKVLDDEIKAGLNAALKEFTDQFATTLKPAAVA